MAMFVPLSFPEPGGVGTEVLLGASVGASVYAKVCTPELFWIVERTFVSASARLSFWFSEAR